MIWKHILPILRVINKVLREMQTLSTLAVVRFGHCPPATNTQTRPITIHCAANYRAM